MSRIQEDRSKVSSFEKAGTIELSGSRKSLKITIDDMDHAFKEIYYVSIHDVQTVLQQPKKVTTIVKVKSLNGEDKI